MSSGFIRIAGENFPIPKAENNDKTIITSDGLVFSPELRAELDKLAQYPKVIVDKIDYRIELRLHQRKLTVYSTIHYREVLHKFKQLRAAARAAQTIVEILCWSNDFLLEKYKRDY